MENEMDWTLETYRLDEIHRKFDLPCVVRTTEGYFSETELEGFSQGDIISINSRMILHKVAANFADKTGHFKDSLSDEDGYTVLVNDNEILVPLKYKGKLKVISPIKKYDTVKELADDFPRYAKLCNNLTVETDGNKRITISAGTVVELDRIFPGTAGGGLGKLVILFHQGKKVAVALPMDVKARFRTERDNNEYTVQETIDRYKLPQLVKFVDDEIKRVYTQDLVDGIENMTTITDVLQLNRLVSKEVLVGHYKPIEGVENTDSDRFKKRTLIVVPLDNYEIRNIEVNVLISDPDDTYSDVFLVRNVSNTEKIVDGSLYVDFSTSSGIAHISDIKDDDDDDHGDKKDTKTSNSVVTEDDVPPPVPPRRGKPSETPPEIKPKPKLPQKPPDHRRKVEEIPQEDYEILLPPAPAVKPTCEKSNIYQQDQVPEAEGDYEFVMPPAPAAVKPILHKSNPYQDKAPEAGRYYNITIPKKSTVVSKPTKSVTQNRRSFDDETQDYEEVTPPSPDAPGMGFTLAGLNFEDKDRSSVRNKKKILKALENMFVKKKMAKVKPEEPEVITERLCTEDAIYEEVDEEDIKDGVKKKNVYTPNPTRVTDFNSPDRSRDNIPVARVKPSIQAEFCELSVIELYERLLQADLITMANYCKKENLDGAFFKDMTKKDMEDIFKMHGVNLLKFMQMKEGNWMPPQKY
ncbi:hypothetical protein ACF0H5_005311 [Mactra antiquata]